LTEKQLYTLLNPLQQIARMQSEAGLKLTDIEQTTFSTKVATQSQLRESRKQSDQLMAIKNAISAVKQSGGLSNSAESNTILTNSIQNLGNLFKAQNYKFDQQLKILGEIRDIIKNNAQNQSGSGSQDDNNAESAGSSIMSSFTGGAIAPFVIAGIAVGVLAASSFFSAIPSVSAAQVAVAISIALTLRVIGPIFTEIIESLAGGGYLERVAGNLAGGGTPDLSAKQMLTSTGAATLAIVGMAIGITAAAFVFQAIIPVSAKQLATAVLVGASLIPIAFAFRVAISGIGENTGPDEIAYATLSLIGIAFAISSIAVIWNRTMPDSFPPVPPWEWLAKTGLGLLAFAGTMSGFIYVLSSSDASYDDLIKATAAMALTAAAIVATAGIFAFLPKESAYKAPPVKWSGKVGLSLLAFTGPFALLAYALGGQSADDLIKATVAVGLVGIGIVAISFIFSYLSGNYKAPPYEWSLKSGLALLAFGTSMAAIAMLVTKGGVGVGGLLKGFLAMIVSSLAILAVSWIFQILPGEYYTPPIGWSMKTALGLTVFSGAIAAVGLMTSATGGIGFLLGAVGLIIAAATVLAVAYILNQTKGMEFGGIGEKLTKQMLAPINGMIDAISRLNKEIGVNNILPLAVGIVAIGGSLMFLTAALAGAAVGSLFSAGVDKLKDFFNLDKETGPIVTLDKLAARSNDIKDLGEPLYNIGKGLGSIITFASSDLGSMAKLFDDLQKLNKGFKENKGGIANLKSTMRGVKDSVNNVNVKKVEKTTKLIEAMHQLQKLGSQKSSIDKIGDKLLEAIKELEKVIDKMDTSTSGESAQENNTGTIDQIVNSIKSIANQPNDSSDKSTQDEEIINAIQNLEDRLVQQGIKINED
jgi:hypothetical protein